MNAGLNNRDWELLSEYLDSSLSPSETHDVEKRLLIDPEFNSAFVSLRRTRVVLRAVPDVKRRRNFFLTPDMVMQKKWTWLVPAFSFTSAAAGLLAAILLVMNLLPVGMKAVPIQQDKISAPSIQLAAAPPTTTTEILPAATMVVETNREYSIKPGAVGKAETSADQGTAPSTATGTGAVAPAPVPNMFTGEGQAPAPPAATPLMAKGDETPVESAPAMDAASAIAYTPTVIVAMKAAPEQKVEATIPTAPPSALVLTSSTPAAAYVTSEAALNLQNTTPAESTLSNARVMPEAEPVPSEGQPVETAHGFSIGQWGGVLLLLSIILGITGSYLRKRLR